MGKLTLFVLDGFGIGAMEDCQHKKPEDIHANTHQHLRERVGLQLPFLYELGLKKLVDGAGQPLAAYGKSLLAHDGADTFMGHQELMGSKPGIPAKRLMKDVGPAIKQALIERGYQVTLPISDATILLVEDAVVVGDNLESQLGNIINIVGDLNRLSFAEVIDIGKIVRQQVDTSRVIIFGNQKSNIETILGVVKEGHPGQWGVDSPKANVYGEGYQVLHLGYGVAYERQFAYMAEQAGYPVYRIGKTADVIQANGFADSVVETKAVLEKYQSMFVSGEDNAIFLVNVQETDLAGHKEDCDWYKAVLEMVDDFLQKFIPQLGEDDLLIITADHGNDPTIGHSNHTREQVPILVIGNQVRPISIGTRETMADVAATMAAYLGIDTPEHGISFFQDILIKLA